MAVRPRVTLKIATSLDGKIALANGQSEWITGDKSRMAGRRLRGQHAAIAVGANTVLLDNPQLTTRIAGLDDPVRVIFDSRLRISLRSDLVMTANTTPVWVFCSQENLSKAKTLKKCGVRVLPIERTETGLSVEKALSVLKSSGIDSLLLEGGGELSASFLKINAVDVIEWFRAPLILGGDARDGIGALGLEDLQFSKRFERSAVKVLGQDLREQYMRV